MIFCFNSATIIFESSKFVEVSSKILESKSAKLDEPSLINQKMKWQNHTFKLVKHVNFKKSFVQGAIVISNLNLAIAKVFLNIHTFEVKDSPGLIKIALKEICLWNFYVNLVYLFVQKYVRLEIRLFKQSLAEREF